MALLPNKSDATTVTDAVTLNVKRMPSVNDASTVTDAGTMNVILGPNVNDVTTVTEGLYPLLGVGVSESVTLNMLLFPTVNDATTVTEVVGLNVHVMPTVSDSTTVTESVAVTRSGVATLTISVSDYAILSNLAQLNESITVTDSVSAAVINGAVGGLTISAFDWAMLSNLAQLNESITVTDSVAATIAAPTTRLVNLGEDVAVHDDGQGVALQGGPGATIQVTVMDGVGLSRMIVQSDALPVTEAVALAIATPGSGPAINLFDSLLVSDRAFVIPDDYIFVTESVAIYFRTVNVVASDTATIVESVAGVVQGGGAGSSVKLLANDGVGTSDAATVGLPLKPSVFEPILASSPAFVMLPLMPSPFEAVTITESILPLIGKLTIMAGEDLTIVEAVDLRFSRLLLSIGEDVSVSESAGISRPSQLWETGAVSISAWDEAMSSSGTWQPGAVESTVWA